MTLPPAEGQNSTGKVAKTTLNATDNAPTYEQAMLKAVFDKHETAAYQIQRKTIR